MKEAQVGSVLVVGGGIGGMQASLDLANSGFKVYLLEKEANIGGVMSQLDKTFPTNDCAMCIMSPKLVEISRNPNIELITCADIENVEGTAGNFSVDVKKRPRRVDIEKCTACNVCAEKCPVEFLDEFNQGLSVRNPIHIRYPQGVPAAYAIESEVARCSAACPAGVDVRGYVGLIAQRRYAEAVELIRDKNPFVAICGRVCQHPCEEECKRNWLDQSVAIRALKRFVADHERDKLPKVDPAPRTKSERVAVVGAGPAGLTAAQDLVKMGYGVTVFEKEATAGGMLLTCIPEYRLPRDVLAEDINPIVDLGVELKTNTEIGKNLTLEDLRKQGFNAIVLAVGTQIGRTLHIEGADLQGVHMGLDFLRSLNQDETFQVGRNVIVIGGGNVAMDVARSALRVGAAEAHVVCLESEHEMPAHPWEIQDALKEGVRIHSSLGPKRILSANGKVSGLECIAVRSVFDEKGRFNPIFYEGSEFTLPCDTLFIAIGQAPELSLLQGEGVSVTHAGTVSVDPLTLQTERPGIFAAGDAVSGPASVVEAVEAGHRAAESVDRYLSGKDMKAGRTVRLPPPQPERYLSYDIQRRKISPAPQVPIPEIPVEDRKTEFKEVELPLNEEEAVAEAERCMSCRKCLGCGICEEVCEAEAVVYDLPEETVRLNVGSIILAPGYETFDAALKTAYGYGRYDNVVSSLEFERILSATGPYYGMVLRPSDGEVPRKVAWIQCVGSRDVSLNKGYCSSVCCTYAIKEAVVAKEHASGLEATIFYTDMRTHGKGFERYCTRAEEEYGVRLVRSRVASVEEIPDQGLRIRYESEDGDEAHEDFDMVVLSVGLSPPPERRELAAKMGIELDKYGFSKTSELSPLETTKPGVFVCGAFGGPKDIPETVTQASGAAADAAGILSAVRGSMITTKEYPPEIDVSEQEPRVGVFICNCGINIGGVVNVAEVVEYAKNLPSVAWAEQNMYTCSEDTQRKIRETIEEHGLNRLVVASCSPRTHEPLFQDTLRDTGLNKYLFEMANIRDQDSWVHMHQPELATEKARDLVRMAVAKAKLLEPLKQPEIKITKRALVIGGGVSGMTAALSLASQGFETDLAEKEPVLGGNLRHIHYTLQGEDTQQFLRNLIDQVMSHSLIRVHRETKVESVSGFIGNYKVSLNGNGKREERDVGTIVVATGAEQQTPGEYLFGEDPRIITQRDLEEMLAGDKFDAGGKNIVMIQCVGSRDDEHPYCSRVCCQEAVKNALKIRENEDATNVFVLYRDVRTYGLMEDYYEKARDKGVVFIRFNKNRKPVVETIEGDLRVKVYDEVLGEEIRIKADHVVLAAGIVATPENRDLAKMLKVPLNADNFFLEAHVKLRPVDFATDGIFLCGLAHSPMSIGESIAQAKASASRAATILSSDTILADGVVAFIDKDTCSGCKTCIPVCPYEAIDFDDEEEKAVVNEAVCKGCGICAAACPSGSATLRGFKDSQVIAQIEEVAA